MKKTIIALLFIIIIPIGILYGSNWILWQIPGGRTEWWHAPTVITWVFATLGSIVVSVALGINFASKEEEADQK